MAIDVLEIGKDLSEEALRRLRAQISEDFRKIVQDAYSNAKTAEQADALRRLYAAVKQDASPTFIHSIADIGVLVRETRKSQALSQAELADYAGVGRRVVSELERGVKDTIEIGIVMSVCAALGIDLFARKR